MRPNIVEICMAEPLPYLFINVKAIDFQNVSVSNMQNLSKLFPNTMSADGKYSLLNRDNLTKPIQLQVSRKQKTFSEFFSSFFKSSFKFEHFQKKGDSHSRGISEITESGKQGKINIYKVPFQRILQKATW